MPLVLRPAFPLLLMNAPDVRCALQAARFASGTEKARFETPAQRPDSLRVAPDDRTSSRKRRISRMNSAPLPRCTLRGTCVRRKSGHGNRRERERERERGREKMPVTRPLSMQTSSGTDEPLFEEPDESGRTEASSGRGRGEGSEHGRVEVVPLRIFSRRA